MIIMKRLIKFVFTFLVLTILTSSINMFAIVEAAEENKIIVSFGDSLTYGYTVDGNSYAKIYADANGYELNNFAEVGMTSAELLDLLKTDLNYFNASEILLWIGANDLLQTVNNYASEKGIDYDNITSEDIAFIKSEIQSNEIRSAIQNAIDKFAVNLNEIIKTIKQNSSCKLFLFTQYNPYSGVNIVMPSSGQSLNLGLIAEEWIEKMNDVILKQKNVFIVDTFYAIEGAEEKCVNVDINILTNTFEFDPHLNQAGHKKIYQSLINSIEEINKPISAQKFNIWVVLFPTVGVLCLGVITFFIIRKIKNIKKINQ